MNQSRVAAPESLEEIKLPRRDLILLILLSFLTLFTLVASMELGARWVIPESGSIYPGCMVINDPLTGLQGIPNSLCWEQGPEGQLTEYRFNRCGDRAGMECGPKSPGTYRIVLAGSSFGFGYNVAQEKTFAAMLPNELSQQTGRKIELYNESMAGRFPLQVKLRFHDVMAARPDMILWEITPEDVQFLSAHLLPHHSELSPTKGAPIMKSILQALNFVGKHAHGWSDHIGIMLRHILYENENQGQYVTSYLMNGDNNAGFLRAELSPGWQSHLKQFDAYAADIESQAKAAGIPFAAVLLPNRAQAAMISMADPPAGYDPYKLNNELRSIIERHGGIYIDILPGYRMLSNPEQYYFPVDGHPDADGHAIISHLLARELVRGAIPVLKVAGRQQFVQEYGK